MIIRGGVSDYERHADLYDQRSPGLPGDVEFYLSLARQARAPVLELGCGTGRVTIPIACAGISIVGLDSAASMLAVARRKAKGIQGLRWVEDDMRSFALEERFGLILIPYRSFSHLLTTEDQRRTLARIVHHLQPGARLALNIFNPAVVGLAGAMADRPGGIQSKTQPALKLRYVFRGEMEQLLSSSGFEIEELYGWFDRRPFDERCTEMVWIARKP